MKFLTFLVVLSLVYSSSSLSESEYSSDGFEYMTHSSDVDIPETFDAREEWPKCEMIGKVFDQGKCQSSWAIAAVSAMSDRICIHSNATRTVILSAEDLLGCCNWCRFDCSGGMPTLAWNYWNSTGIVSGSYSEIDEGCKSYSYQACNHFNITNIDSDPCPDAYEVALPTCQKTCDNTSSTDYNNDLYYGSAYKVYPTEEQLKLEIMTNGPVEATFNIFTDFLSYKSGVYIHPFLNSTLESDYIGETSAKIIGWGIEDNQQYWLGINTLGENWGENGVFKFLIGQNEDDIVQQALAGLPTFNSE